MSMQRGVVAAAHEQKSTTTSPLPSPASITTGTTASTQQSKEDEHEVDSPERPYFGPFAATEMPRQLTDGTVTPSWFRYANMDIQDQGDAAMPKDYEWQVKYYRREDGRMITQPVLAEKWEDPPEPKKAFKDLAEFAVCSSCLRRYQTS